MGWDLGSACDCLPLGSPSRGKASASVSLMHDRKVSFNHVKVYLPGVFDPCKRKGAGCQLDG